MISVVIPAYNAEKFLPETLDSILAQTYQQFEIIVIDDGSTDQTIAVVEAYAAKDNRIQLIKSQHQRQSKARNAGIAIARYPWIAPIDADDIILPNRFERQLEIAEQRSDVVAWASYANRVTIEGRAYRKIEPPPITEDQFHEMRSKRALITFPNSSVLLRKEIILAVGGYDPTYDGLEDVELVDRMADQGLVLVIPEVLMHYRMYQSSTTGAFKSFRKQRILFKYLEKRNQLRLKGKDIELDHFLQMYNNVSPAKRVFRNIDDLSGFQFKLGALRWGERRFGSAIRSLTLSFLSNPYYIISRLFTRFVLRKYTRHI